MPKWTEAKRDPFETLIVTIISQNTADRNTARAFERLSKLFEISGRGLTLFRKTAHDSRGHSCEPRGKTARFRTCKRRLQSCTQ
jgi:hypothetical protein